MDGITALADAIVTAVQEELEKEQRNGSIQTGYISGSYVQIGTALYPYTLGVDVNVYDGARVYCQLDAARSRAVIVGC